MGVRLTEIFVSDVQVGDTIHCSEGQLTVESWVVDHDVPTGKAPKVWWILFGRDHRNEFHRYRFEGSEVVWCLREDSTSVS